MALGRKLLLLAALCGPAWSQTGLTTIQDTLFKADGARFSGTITIQWSTFDVTNVGTIVQQSKSVPIVNGNLFIQLAPNAAAPPPANIYYVRYQSDGREQFSETWTVPAAPQAVRVSVVRTGTVVAGTAADNQTPIPESAVIGLQADLAVRPRKGVGFGTNRVAVVDDAGALETAVGNVADCVFVDGTSGPCSAHLFADAETPGGIVDGTNTTFTLANTPLGLSLMLFRNGLYMTPNFDYVLTGSSVVFNSGAVPQPGDTLTASYRVDPAAAGNIAAGVRLASIDSSGAPPAIVRTVAAQVICSLSGSITSSVVWGSLGVCDLSTVALQPGDRIEIRFNLGHSGTASGFDFDVKWGTTTLLARHASARDSAVAGRADGAITGAGAQLSVESWGTVMPFLSTLLNQPAQAQLRIGFDGKLSARGSDTVALTNFTVLRYPTTPTDAR